MKPVWSQDGRSLMYVRVRQSSGAPGAVWTVCIFHVGQHRSESLPPITAMNVLPLGWKSGFPLLLVANTTDSSLWAWQGRKLHLKGILLPQPIVHASLAPDARFIAVGAPTNCNWCTLDTYNLRTVALWTGPTGMPSELDIAWTASGRYVAALLAGRLVLARPEGEIVGTFAVPPSLPRVWEDTFSARLDGGNLALTDTVTGRSWTALRGAVVLV